MRFFPELQQSLGDAAGAQEAVDTVAAQARQQTLDYQRGAARHFLNAEPPQAVQAALSSKNPVADFNELSRIVSADPDAKAGLKRAVADYVTQRIIGNTEAGTSGIRMMKSDAFQSFLQRNEPALKAVFSPDEMQSIANIAADLQRSNRSLLSSKIPGQSNTAQDLHATGGIGGKLSVLSQYLGHGIAGLAGYLIGGVHGAIEGSGGYAMAKGAFDAMKRSGIERTDQLLTEALLNPELAKTLLMRASPANRPLVAQRLGSQLGTLAGVSGAEAAENGNRPRSQASGALPAAVAQPVPNSNPGQMTPTLALKPGGAVALSTLAQILARSKASATDRAAPQFNPLAAILARGSYVPASP
jgi:hypothetical protein